VESKSGTINRVKGREINSARRKSGSEPSSALNQVNNQDDDRNYEQEMDQTAANVADEAKKPENDQDDNYGPEHGYTFSVELNFRRRIYSEVHLLAKLFQNIWQAYNPTPRFVPRHLRLCAFSTAMNIIRHPAQIAHTDAIFHIKCSQSMLPPSVETTVAVPGLWKAL
jgi:hypothetical protein